jgi:hypothetical protein
MEEVIPMRLYTVPFSYTDVEKHVCLLPDEVRRSEAMDCVINTAYFLKILKKNDAEIYSRVIHKEKMPGLSSNQIIDMVFREFTLLSKTQDAIINIEVMSLKRLKGKLEPNTCTFVGFTKPDGSKGHAVVIFKDKNGDLGIFDGLMNELIHTKGLKSWLEKHSYSSEKVHVLYETNKRIRKSDRKDEKQPAKRVRLLSPKSEKSKSKSKSMKSKSLKSKKNIKVTGLELDKKRRLRISQKVKKDKEKRENLLELNRREPMVEE